MKKKLFTSVVVRGAEPIEDMFSGSDGLVGGGAIEGLDEHRVIRVDEEHDGAPGRPQTQLLFRDQHPVFL